MLDESQRRGCSSRQELPAPCNKGRACAHLRPLAAVRRPAEVVGAPAMPFYFQPRPYRFLSPAGQTSQEDVCGAQHTWLCKWVVVPEMVRVTIVEIHEAVAGFFLLFRITDLKQFAVPLHGLGGAGAEIRARSQGERLRVRATAFGQPLDWG